MKDKKESKYKKEDHEKESERDHHKKDRGNRDREDRRGREKREEDERKDRYKEKDWSFEKDKNKRPYRSRSRSRERSRDYKEQDRVEDRSRSKHERDDREGSKKDDDSDHRDKLERHVWENPRVERQFQAIQDRRAIWNKRKQPGSRQSEDSTSPAEPSSSFTTTETTHDPDLEAKKSAWTNRLAAATTDTSQINKFARLLGMKKNQPKEAATSEDLLVDEKKVKEEQEKQKNLTQGLEMEYETARMWNKQRGRGIGFSG